jgi:hypothetical protein
MAESRADRCRKNAEDCRYQAGKSPKATDKASWLKMAEDWLKLAESIDASSQGGAAQIQTEPLPPVVTMRRLAGG